MFDHEEVGFEDLVESCENTGLRLAVTSVQDPHSFAEYEDGNENRLFLPPAPFNEFLSQPCL